MIKIKADKQGKISAVKAIQAYGNEKIVSRLYSYDNGEVTPHLVESTKLEAAHLYKGERIDPSQIWEETRNGETVTVINP